MNASSIMAVILSLAPITYAKDSKIDYPTGFFTCYGREVARNGSQQIPQLIVEVQRGYDDLPIVSLILTYFQKQNVTQSSPAQRIKGFAVVDKIDGWEVQRLLIGGSTLIFDSAGNFKAMIGNNSVRCVE